MSNSSSKISKSSLAAANVQTDSPLIFNRQSLRHHRDRAAALLPQHDFLIHESATRLAEQFEDIIAADFPLALDLGCRLGHLGQALNNKAGITTLIHSDLSPNMLAHNPSPKLAVDEEFLPFAPESLNLILSNLTLHWVNDLPGCLIQIYHALKKDGLFLASILGGNTLHELRTAIMEAEMANPAGIAPRLAPFVEVKDAGALLQRAGFALPVSNSESITVLYHNAYDLMRDLRAMGETNALITRNTHFTTRTTLQRIADTYQERFQNEEGLIPATFELITLTGWKN